jgi:hypothetical protein
MRDDSSTCLRFESNGKNGTSPATLHARGVQFTMPTFPLADMQSVQVIMGLRSSLRGGFRRGPSATFCKAACLNTQQTVKNDVNRPCRGAAVLCDSFYGKAFNQTGM